MRLIRNFDSEYRRRFRQKAEKDKQEAEQKRREAEEEGHVSEITASLQRVEQELKRSNDENTPQKNRDRLWDRFGVGGLWVAAAVGIAAIWVGSYDAGEQRRVMGDQLTAMKGQLDEMKVQQKLARAQVAAHLQRNGIKMTPTYNNNQLTGWEVNPGWRNVGGTDAREFVSWFDIRPFGGRLIGEPDCSVKEPVGPPAPGVMQPQDSNMLVAKWLSVEDATKAHNQAGFILIVGHAEYRDIFYPDTPQHHFDWCVYVVPNDIARNTFSFIDIRAETD